MGDRARGAMGEVLRSERGIALPMAMLMTAICLGFAAVPILASINTQTASSRDQSGNMALAAADAGLSLAMLRQNQAEPTTAGPCVSETGGKLVLGKAQASGVESGWCTPVTMTASSSPAPPPGTEVTYRVRPCYPESGCSGFTACESTSENLVKVVSTGKATVSSHTVERRVSGAACSKQETKETKTETTTPPPNVFLSGQIVGIESLSLSNNAQVYHGGAGSNGSVFMTGNANVCGTVRYGTTHEETNNSNIPPSNCSEARTFVKGTSEYPPVTLPAGLSTNNSNSRLVNNGGTVLWNASNRSLVVGNNGSLTLDGTAPYFLCSLEVTGNATLLAAPGAEISIFFDEPSTSKCPGLNGAPQLRLWNNAKVLPDSGTGPDFYFLGSATNPSSSTVELQGNGQAWQFVVYAPNSQVKAANNFSLNGIVVGRTLEFAGNASINKERAFTPPAVEEFLGSTTTTTITTSTAPKPFARKSYIQCSSVATSTSPESGC